MMSHYPTIAGDPGSRCLYDTIREILYCLCMAANVDYAVQNCKSCAWNYLNNHDEHNMQLFASVPLECTAMDIVRPFSKNCLRGSVQPNYYRYLLEINVGSSGIKNDGHVHCESLYALLAHPLRHLNISPYRQRNTMRKKILRNSMRTTRSQTSSNQDVPCKDEHPSLAIQ